VIGHSEIFDLVTVAAIVSMTHFLAKKKIDFIELKTHQRFLLSHYVAYHISREPALAHY
jgi:hypothetical protein